MIAPWGAAGRILACQWGAGGPLQPRMAHGTGDLHVRRIHSPLWLREHILTGASGLDCLVVGPLCVLPRCLGTLRGRGPDGVPLVGTPSHTPL